MKVSKGILSIAPVVIFLSLFPSLAPQGAKEKTFDAESLYNHGMKLLKRGYYEKAIEKFEKVKNHFPFTGYAPLAELRIGDCYFERGEYPSAAELYLIFLKLHPEHEEAPYAAWRVGLSYYKESPLSASKDQTYTEKMASFFRDYRVNYPDSKYLSQVEELLKKGRNKLAKKELIIGKYYFKKRVYPAAIARLEGLLQGYGDTEYAGAARLYLARAYFGNGEREKAIHILQELIGKGEGRIKKRAAKFLNIYRSMGREGK